MWYLKIVLVFLIFDSFTSGQILPKKDFVTLHQWTHLEMTFPTEQIRELQIKNGHFNTTKILPVDVNIEYSDDGFHRTFITFPRLNFGVPYSLAVVTENDNSTILNPKVRSYPDFEWHSSHGYNCSGITSAIRTCIDECWRLWVVDSGQINSLQYCSPQILVFDLVNDTLVHRYILPNSLYIPELSVFTALAIYVNDVDGRTDCAATMVYITDTWGFGIIVYDFLTSNSWRIEHELMRPDKDLQKFNLANDGIFTVNISPKTVHPNDRKLYFHALNSHNEVSVPLRIVNNASIWKNNTKAAKGIKAFQIIGNRGIQCESETIDSEGNLYCSLLKSNAIIKWNHNTAYTPDTLQVVAYNPDQLKFITGLKVHKNPYGEEEVWALSNEPAFFIGGLTDLNAIKFRVIGCRTKNLLHNKQCSIYAV